MGEYAMTCSATGLSIPAGTPVRCVLLTASPYEEQRHEWIMRTPPLRAVYNGYGTIEQIHKDDQFIAGLWLRGLREDLVEVGMGDNPYHDVPAAKDMPLDQLLEAIRAGRLKVRQDVKYFWRRPRPHEHHAAPYAAHQGATLQAIEYVLKHDGLLVTHFPDPVARTAIKDKFSVDEPVPCLVRVRFGHYQSGKNHYGALSAALAAIQRAGFVGVVTSGSGRCPGSADLLVFPAPGVPAGTPGPQWDMASGQADDKDKHLVVRMAMVREDVWQAVARYPHSDSVMLDCTTCGQSPSYHALGRVCPGESINNKPFKKHPENARYTRDAVFFHTVEHVVVPNDYGETVWYDLDAYQAGTRATWNAVLGHFAARDAPTIDPNLPKPQRQTFDALLEKAYARLYADAENAAERNHKEDPHFGDFLMHHLDDHILGGPYQPGAWLFRDSVPGIIGVAAHLSMCLADKLDVPLSLLDTLAELSAVSHALADVGAPWRPSTATGPQYPDWNKSRRFAQTVQAIAQAEGARAYRDDDEEETFDDCLTLAEVKQRLSSKDRE